MPLVNAPSIGLINTPPTRYLGVVNSVFQQPCRLANTAAPIFEDRAALPPDENGTILFNVQWVCAGFAFL